MSRWTEILEVLAGELDQQLNGLTSRMDEISSRVTTLGERVGVDSTAGVPLLTQDERVKAIMREALETDSGVVFAINSVVRTEIEKAVEDGVVAAYDHEHDDQYAELEHEHDEYASTSTVEDIEQRVEEVASEAPDTEAINGRLDRLEERCDAAGRKLTDM
jgi:tetrahydromethanopterin S-methyltransferase subunit G